MTCPDSLEDNIMNKYGICEWLLPIPGPTSFKLAAHAGYDGVQMLDWGGRENNYPLNLTWVQDTFRQAMDDNNICIQNLQLQSLVRSGGVKAAPDTAQGKAALEDIRKGAEVCAALNIPNLQLENFFNSAIQNTEDIKNTAELLKEAGKVTSDLGVQLVYESWFDYSGTMDIYEMSGQSFKLCYDTLNPLRYHFGDPIKELEQYDLSMLAFVHVKDAPAGCGYQGSWFLGQGEGRINEAAAILKKRGYKGWIVTENYYCMNPIGIIDPSKTIIEDLRTMHRLFD